LIFNNNTFDMLAIFTSSEMAPECNLDCLEVCESWAGVGSFATCVKLFNMRTVRLGSDSLIQWTNPGKRE